MTETTGCPHSPAASQLPPPAMKRLRAHRGRDMMKFAAGERRKREHYSYQRPRRTAFLSPSRKPIQARSS